MIGEESRLPADCIVLAAGLSTRMGTWKLLLPFQGKTVIERSVENALAVCRRVILVTGHRGEELERLFAGRDRVMPVRNADYERGMFSSIRRGAAEAAGEAVFLTPGDMPRIDPAVFRLLFSRCEASPPEDTAFRPVRLGRGGHPLLMRRPLLGTILGLPPEASMGEVFSLMGPPVSVASEAPGILEDLDTPEDYEGLNSVR